MSTLSRQAGPTLPGQVTAVRILVAIQAAFQLLAALGDMVVGSSNGKVAAGVVTGLVDLAIGVALVAAVVKLGSCEPWTRVAVMVFEGLVVLEAVAVMVATGHAFGILGIVLACVVVGLLVTAPARACFARAERR